MNHRPLLIMMAALLASACGVAPIFAGASDCNNNGVPDTEELSGNDCNANGVLDVCENESLGDVVELTVGVLGIGQYPSVDVEGRRLVIGPSTGLNPEGVLTDIVTIWRRGGSGWEVEQTLYGPAAGSGFGASVDLANDRLAVAAPSDSSLGSISRGSVWLFRFDSVSQVWVDDGVLYPAQQSSNGRIFGQDIAFDGNQLFVSDERTPSTGIEPRQIHCYRQVNGNWRRRQGIYDSGEDTVTVWNPRRNFMQLGDGTLLTLDYVRVYEIVTSPALCLVIHDYDGTAWVPTARIQVPGVFAGTASPLSGAVVTRDRIVACISREPRRLFVLENLEGQWNISAEFATPAIPGISGFGYWIAGDGEWYLVGALLDGEPVVFELRFDGGVPTLSLRDELSGQVGLGVLSGNHLAGGYFEPVLHSFEVVRDCDDDGILDQCVIASGDADMNGDLVPDSCQLDCNQDGIPDVAQLVGNDCDANGVLDACDIDVADPDGDGFVANDCNLNGQPDSCEYDCDGNSIPDDCDLDVTDPDGDGFVADDCNGNGIPDACDIRQRVSQLAILRPSDSASGIQFGRTLATEEDILVVGAPPTGQAGRGGRAYVFRNTGTHWLEEAILMSDANPNDVVFGTRVGISNGRIFVSEENLVSALKSIVHVFEFSGGAWSLVASIEVDTSFYARFDLNFAVHGDDLVSHLASRAGVRHFRHDGENWVLVGLYGGAPFQPVFQVNKRSIAMGADAIAFGERTPTSSYHARAHIYDTNGPSVQFDESVVSVMASGADDAEQPIQLAGDLLFVGYPFTWSNEIAGVQTGSVDVYRRHDGGWQREAHLNEEEPNEPNQGWSMVALSDRVFVGSPRADGGIGRVRLYASYGRRWGIRYTIESPFAGIPIEFGASLAVSERFLAVGAGTGSLSPLDSELDAVVIYSTDLDADDDGIFDGCEIDCDDNNYPDDGERTIGGIVAALLHDGAACVFDLNDDGELNGLDVPVFVDLLLTGP